MLAIGSGGQHWVSRTTLKNVCWREVSTKENVFVLPSLVAGDGLVRHACQILHLWRHLVILRCWGLRVLRVHFDDQPFADRRVHPPVVGAFNMDTRVLHT